MCQLPVELAAVTRSFPSCLPDLVRIYSVNGSTAKGKRVKSNTVLIVRMFAIDVLNESNYSRSPRVSMLSMRLGELPGVRNRWILAGKTWNRTSSGTREPDGTNSCPPWSR